MVYEISIGRTSTSIVRDGDDTEIAYHGTKVVVFNDASITLDTRGFFTVTTKRRMNEASNMFNLGYQVNQVKGRWIVRFKGKDYPYRGDRLSLDRKSGDVWGINSTLYGVNLGRILPMIDGRIQDSDPK